ncbi:MAG: BNR-4 repeat-containing protein [Novipirellula sp. JB048]
MMLQTDGATAVLRGTVWGWTALLLVTWGAELAVANQPISAGSLAVPADLNEGEMPLRLGGVGGVYLLAEPGELIVDVFKQNLRRSPRSYRLRAVLVGPDRRVVQEQFIADDGDSAEPGSRIRFSTKVPRKGVYALNITVANDRYGTAVRWGFRTNCRHYLVETARGHRDEAHQEPIVVDSPSRAGDICFLPRPGTFKVELSGLAESVDTVTVFDGRDRLVQTIPVDRAGQAAHEFEADPSRGDTPWRIHLTAYQGTVQIDGVTRWDRRDAYRDLCCWSPHRESWFPLLEYRWLVTPYQRTVLQRTPPQREADAATQTFRIHNNSAETQTILLELEFPDQPWPAKLSQSSVRLNPKAATEVSIAFAELDAASTKRVHLRATPENHPGFSTFATLTVEPSRSAQTLPLELPLTLKPYQHEPQQLGYVADYPLDNQVYFDLENRPYVVSRRHLWRKVEDRWVSSELDQARRDGTLSEAPVRTTSSKVAFDADHGVYLLGRCGGASVLLHSSDRGATFTAYAIPAYRGLSSVFDMEQFSGHNVLSGPPPLVRYTRTASDPKLKWRRVNQIDLLLPKREADRIVFGEPSSLSDTCIGFSAHSGIPSSLVSRGENVHVVWGEATDPQQQVPGVPGYVATYHRDSNRLSEPTLVGYGPPANDVHNSPSITLDDQGFLHLLIGTHGRPFPYVRSQRSSGVAEKWSVAEPMSEARQTYVGLVSGTDGTLHTVYRMWRSGVEPHPDSTHAVLAYSRKPPGQPWSEPQVLVVPPFSEYSVFYHRLTIDRRGGLWLSYDYWSTFWFYRNDHHGSRRALMTSPDGGATWYMASQDRAP